jgi:hypothetical protein
MKTLMLLGVLGLVLLGSGPAEGATALGKPKARKVAMKAEKSRARATVDRAAKNGVYLTAVRSRVTSCERLTARIVECNAWTEFEDDSDFEVDNGQAAMPEARCTTIHRVSVRAGGHLWVGQPYGSDCVTPES